MKRRILIMRPSKIY